MEESKEGTWSMFSKRTRTIVIQKTSVFVNVHLNWDRQLATERQTTELKMALVGQIVRAANLTIVRAITGGWERLEMKMWIWPGEFNLPISVSPPAFSVDYRFLRWWYNSDYRSNSTEKMMQGIHVSLQEDRLNANDECRCIQMTLSRGFSGEGNGNTECKGSTSRLDDTRHRLVVNKWSAL